MLIYVSSYYYIRVLILVDVEEEGSDSDLDAEYEDTYSSMKTHLVQKYKY